MISQFQSNLFVGVGAFQLSSQGVSYDGRCHQIIIIVDVLANSWRDLHHFLAVWLVVKPLGDFHESLNILLSGTLYENITWATWITHLPFFFLNIFSPQLYNTLKVYALGTDEKWWTSFPVTYDIMFCEQSVARVCRIALEISLLLDSLMAMPLTHIVYGASLLHLEKR